MDRKFKENTCLKTPANSNLISQVYQNSMALFISYSNLRKSFEADIMSNIETSLAAALNSLATEKVSKTPESGPELLFLSVVKFQMIGTIRYAEYHIVK